ncbi:MAG TPA: mechanosensitive ion channel family protein [Acidimicrobiia bacterium]|nr:mechanosensitive ion channel family protein [Acidimicrobiia bacterium]
MLGITSLDDLDHWARGPGLEIVMLVTGAVLLARAVGWLGDRITHHIDAHAREHGDLVVPEATKHRHAVTQVCTWVLVVLVYLVATVLVLQRLGVPLTALIAPATVIGVAVGFGAQRIVQDLLAGFFLVAERQYGYGDVVRIAPLGATSGVSGTVEDVTLRITRLRTVNGEVVIVPNGQITQVTNLSSDWARAVVDVPVPIAADMDRVYEILDEVCEQIAHDESGRRLLLDRPSVTGVETFEVDQVKVRVLARTLPGKQFEIGRDLRARIAFAFRRAGITVPTGLEAARPTATP